MAQKGLITTICLLVLFMSVMIIGVTMTTQHLTNNDSKASSNTYVKRNTKLLNNEISTLCKFKNMSMDKVITNIFQQGFHYDGMFDDQTFFKDGDNYNAISIDWYIGKKIEMISYHHLTITNDDCIYILESYLNIKECKFKLNEISYGDKKAFGNIIKKEINSKEDNDTKIEIEWKEDGNIICLTYNKSICNIDYGNIAIYVY